MVFDLQDRKSQVAVAAAATGVLAAGWLVHRSLRRNKIRVGPFTPNTLPNDAYDAIIVGAGECT